MKKLFACLLVGALLAGPAHAQVEPIDGIAAVVDEDVVLRSELDRAIANIRSQYVGREDQLPPAAVLERQVAERLVLLKLQVARARDTGVRVGDQEVDQAIAAIAGQNGATTQQLVAQLAADGLDFEQFRDSVREELMIQHLRNRFAQSEIAVTDAEVDAALQAQAGGGQQYHIAHILVGLPEGATPEQINTAQQKIEGIKALLDRGEMNFAAAAVRYSDSPNALEGGDLGWRGRNEIPSAFSQLVAEMSPGEVTAPIRGPSGFQLVQLVDARDGSQAGTQMATQVRASHILIRTAEGTDPAEARAEADTLHARLVGGASFEELARTQSQDTSSQANGGDLGWFMPQEYGPEFATVLAGLRDGELSQPFQTPAGWHIVKLTGTREADIGDQSRRAQVREMLGRRKLEDRWERFVREMRNEAYVDLRASAPDDDAQAD
ncbi:peptidylprolyl isomerase [Lysobacter sp. GX 14042]|uniref:peptidylprolyl isomerase n=1 Tax=Lysobacter sp. GX 14042 TaxID=2907155 RepID=UPI001F39F6AE|nr:peptidylprolyl isomerase [Lysobacter sp. GX 14042]MCE7031083.1 peptidylprolyl isomerase [Lysobacter sp. GX 14042]